MKVWVRRGLLAAASLSAACNATLGITVPDDGGATQDDGGGSPPVPHDGGASDVTVMPPTTDAGTDATTPSDAKAGADAPSPPIDGGGGSDADASNANACGGNVDLQSDPSNCGRCGHDCGGATCVGGMCSAYVVQGQQDYTTALAVDATGIYWTSEAYSGVYHCPGTSCASAPTLLTGTQGQPWELALGGGKVFWEADQASGAMILSNAVTKLGPTGDVFVTRPTVIRALAADDTDVFWSESNGSYQTYRCPQTGCDGGIPVFSDVVYDLVTDGTHLVWASNLSSLKFCTKANCAQQYLIQSGLANAQNVALHGGVAYVSDTGGANPTTGSISACPLNGTNCKPGNFAPGLTSPRAIAVDDSGVYWAAPESTDAGDTNGAIFMCPLAGCPSSGPTVVAAGQTGGVGLLAVYGTLVFFTSGGPSSPYIMAVVKP